MTELETLERAKTYVEKLANGVPVKEIATTLKRTGGAIRSRLKKLGLAE